MQKIVPHLWFDTQAKEAAEFYCSAFPDSKIVNTTVLHDTPSGDCDFVSFNLNGHDFLAISAGPYFKANPSVSFTVNFDLAQDAEASAHLQQLWDKLFDGGTALMPLDEYPFSKQYGWVQDRFGISWQLMLAEPGSEPRPYITPSLMFAGGNTGKTEEAVQFYMDVFKDSKRGVVAHYLDDDKAGLVMFTDFMLEGQWFSAMDAGNEHDFTFNEAISLLINCDTQEEVDYYWEKLSAVPESEQCGWLKDKYGVSWQVSPTFMHEVMSEGTSEQIASVTQAFLKMKKFDIAALEEAYQKPQPS